MNTTEDEFIFRYHSKIIRSELKGYEEYTIGILTMDNWRILCE